MGKRMERIVYLEVLRYHSVSIFASETMQFPIAYFQKTESRGLDGIQ